MDTYLTQRYEFLIEVNIHLGEHGVQWVAYKPQFCDRFQIATVTLHNLAS